MEFEGRITKVLPVRSGTGKNGEWKALPFVFEYFENGEQRWSDKVILETMDHDVMRAIGQYVERGQDNKGIEVNGEMKLKGEIKCRCGFSHSVREWEGKYFNQVRLYKFEILTEQNVAVPQQQAPSFPPPYPPIPQTGENDDLPF